MGAEKFSASFFALSPHPECVSLDYVIIDSFFDIATTLLLMEGMNLMPTSCTRIGCIAAVRKRKSAIGVRRACTIGLLWIGVYGLSTAIGASPQQSGNIAVGVQVQPSDFFAAIRVAPKEFAKHPYFGSLPIERFLPHPVSISRLQSMGISELTVYCAPGKGPAYSADSPLEWAAVAHTLQPIDLARFIEAWHSTVVPNVKPITGHPTPFRFEDLDCIRVDAGTFLEPARKFGKLSLTNDKGLPVEQGVPINRGTQRWQYLEGATNWSAIFSFEQIDEHDFSDGILTLDFRSDAVLITEDDRNLLNAEIVLRNPDTGPQSAPIPFQFKPHVNWEIAVPRETRKATGSITLDVMKHIVSKGRFDVVLKARDRNVYVGVAEKELSIRRRTYEYVKIADRTITVAQTPEALRRLLSNAAAPISTKLSQSKADIAVAVAVRDRAERSAIQELIPRITGERTATQWGSSLAELTATVQMKDRLTAKVTAKFTDPNIAADATQRFKHKIRQIKADARLAIHEGLWRTLSLNNLLSIAHGISVHFPKHELESFDWRKNALSALIEICLFAITARVDHDRLTLEFIEPAVLAKLPDLERIAIANWDQSVSRNLFADGRHDLGVDRYKLVTDLFPSHPHAWVLRSHELSYNVAGDFGGYEDRYVWIRRGVEVLLDGMEQNADRTDLMWMAARIIGWRTGDFGGSSKALRELFSKDTSLHLRLKKWIDLEKARAPNGTIDNWLVAKLLAAQSFDRKNIATNGSMIVPVNRIAMAAWCQVHYAQRLNESGSERETTEAWKEAERLYKELAAQKFLDSESKLVCLNDWESQTKNFGPTDPTANRLKAERNRIHLDYWITRCKFEQDPKVRSASKLAQKGNEHNASANFGEAYEAYEQAFQLFTEVHMQNPKEMALFAGEFKREASYFASIAKLAALPASPRRIRSILELIKKSEPHSENPFVNNSQRELKKDRGANNR